MRPASLLALPGVAALSTLAWAGSLDIDRSQRFEDGTGKPVVVTVVSAHPNRVNFRALYPPEHVNQDSGSRTSLVALAAAKPFSGLRRSPRFIVSVSPNGFRSDVPIGLLISDGIVKSLVDGSPPRDVGAATCSIAAAAQYRYSGILCGSDMAPSWRIVDVGEYQPRMCRNAVQSGPMLVDPSGTIGVCPLPRLDSRPVSRLAVCLDAANVMHFVYTAPVDLFSLATWLKEGRLKCKVALGLSGDQQAGIAELATTSRPFGSRHVGASDFPLASAIYLEAK